MHCIRELQGRMGERLSLQSCLLDVKVKLTKLSQTCRYYSMEVIYCGIWQEQAEGNLNTSMNSPL